MSLIKDNGMPVLRTPASACVQALLDDVGELADVSSEKLTELMGVLETEYINRLAQTYGNEGEADYVG